MWRMPPAGQQKCNELLTWAVRSDGVKSQATTFLALPSQVVARPTLICTRLAWAARLNRYSVRPTTACNGSEWPTAVQEQPIPADHTGLSFPDGLPVRHVPLGYPFERLVVQPIVHHGGLGQIELLRAAILKAAARQELALREVEREGEFYARPGHPGLAIYRRGDVEQTGRLRPRGCTPWLYSISPSPILARTGRGVPHSHRDARSCTPAKGPANRRPPARSGGGSHGHWPAFRFTSRVAGLP